MMSIAVKVHFQLLDARGVSRCRAVIRWPLAADPVLLPADILTHLPDPFDHIVAGRWAVVDLEAPDVVSDAVASDA